VDDYELSKAVDTTLTYASLLAGIKVGSIDNLTPRNSHLITSHNCGASESSSFEIIVGSGVLALEYFQDYNPSPIGAYILVCLMNYNNKRPGMIILHCLRLLHFPAPWIDRVALWEMSLNMDSFGDLA
jgi:hypothetical protein